MNELLPCPFCGSDDVIIENHVDDIEMMHPYISCIGCGTYGPQTSKGDENIAIERWNKRDELAQTSQQSYKLMNNIIAHERMIGGLQMNYLDLARETANIEELIYHYKKMFSDLQAQRSEIDSLSQRLNNEIEARNKQ